MLHPAFLRSQLVGLCKFPAKYRDLAAVSAQGHAGCITPVPECFKSFYSRKHQLLWDSSRASLFWCLSSRKLAAVIKIKQKRKWLALPSGLFIKMKICNWCGLRWYPKIPRRREGGLILVILVHPHWHRIKIWHLLFYLCMLYLQKQTTWICVGGTAPINRDEAAHRSVSASRHSWASHGFVQKNQICQTGKRNSILGPISKLTLSTVIFVNWKYV